MLFLKPRNQLTVEDIRAFCRRFDEGIRVEYKQDFGQGVRDKIPKVVSSFGNSYGGALVIGVKTNKGKPVEPIEGFDKPGNEELSLTVENICHQHIYPLLMPQITEIVSEITGKAFLLVEVEPSPEAPHAIENSRKVYIRTGSSSNPYDLADINLIERLIKRRDNVLRHRQRFESDANVLVQRFVQYPTGPKVRVIVGPRFVHASLIDRERAYQFLRDTPFRGARFYMSDQLRRLPTGACGGRDDRAFGYLDTFGQVFHQEVVKPVSESDEDTYYRVQDLGHPILQAVTCASRLYESAGYLGEVSLDVTAFDLADRPFWHDSIGSLKSAVETIPAEYTVSSELLNREVAQIVTALTHQLLWPMRREPESITEAQVRTAIQGILKNYHP